MAMEIALSQNKSARGHNLPNKKNSFHKFRQINYYLKRRQRRLRMLMTRQRTFLRTTSRLSSLLFWKIQATLKNCSAKPT